MGIVFFILTLLALTNYALAAEDILAIDIKTLVIQIIIFVSAIFILNKLLFKPLLQLVDKRERMTVGTLKQARELRDRVQQIIEEYSEKMDEARAQALDERNVIRKSAQDAAEELVRKVCEDSKVIIDDSIDKLRKEIEANKARIRPDVQIVANEIVNRLID